MILLSHSELKLCPIWNKSIGLSIGRQTLTMVSFTVLSWWRHQMKPYSALLALCVGMYPLICAWINGWANNREAGNLRRHRAHYDITVMSRTLPLISGSFASSVNHGPACPQLTSIDWIMPSFPHLVIEKLQITSPQHEIGIIYYCMLMAHWAAFTKTKILRRLTI